MYSYNNDQNTYMNELARYRKVQDNIGYLGLNCTKYNYINISINTILYKGYTNKNNEKVQRYYYREVSYTDKDTNMEHKKIMREIDCYVSIESGKVDQMSNDFKKEYLMLRQGDLEMMYMLLEPYIQTYCSNMGSIYKTRDKKTIIDESKIGVLDIPIGYNGSINIRPGLYLTMDNETKPCLDMKLNREEYSLSKVSPNQIFGLVNMGRTLSLPSYASSVCNYLGMPPLGTNNFSRTNNIVTNEVGVIDYKPNRTIPGNQKKKGWFDK